MEGGPFTSRTGSSQGKKQGGTMVDASKSKRRQMLPRTGGMASSATENEGTTEEAGKLQSRPIEELDSEVFQVAS